MKNVLLMHVHGAHEVHIARLRQCQSGQIISGCAL